MCPTVTMILRVMALTPPGTIVGQCVGVAPRAKLLVGKVCGADFCDMSAIASGINWGD